MHSQRIFPYVLAASGLLFLSACTVGPDYARPAAPVPAAFKEGGGWKIAQPQDARVGHKWWRLFDDPELSALEEQVVISNQNVLAAEARLRQALALVREARSGYYPGIAAGASVARSQRSGSLGSGNSSSAAGIDGSGSGGTGGSTVGTFYSLPVELSWEADLWGRIRRSVEANGEGARASEADLAAAQLSAQAELAQNYFLLRSQDALQQLFDETAASYQKALELTRNRYESGVSARADLLQAETQWKTAQAQALDLGVQRARLEHAIALLAGRPASSFSIAAAPMKQAFPAIPAGLPSQLLERRPDIAAAERRMAAANARIGIAEGAYYPSVRLTAAAGLEALRFADWISWPSRFWALGSSVSQAVFDAGLRRARSEEARAAYDATVAAYRQTVLAGFQEVEDNLAALRILQAEAMVMEDAVTASREALAVTLNQYRSGIVGYLNVIVSNNAALANRRDAVELRGRRLVATVLLIRALGGGWDVGVAAGEGER